MKTFKRIILTLLPFAGLLLPQSCTKEGGLVPGDARTEVRFVTGAGTKAAVTQHEESVQTLDLLAFRADDGRLDAYNRVTGGSTVSGSLSVGVQVRYYVVANAPEHVLDGFSTESEFLAGKTLLSQSTASTLVMKGQGTLTVAKDNPAVPVILDRYVSKVSIQNVEVKWMDSYPAGTDFRVGRVVLVNAVGDIPWSGTPQAGSLWYNKLGAIDPSDGTPAMDNVMDMLCTGSYSIAVTDDSPVSLSKSVYAMPNPTDSAVNSVTAPEWSVRDTRVALELLVDGVSYWYPVDLPGMLPNRHYVVTRMVLLGPGVDNPDKPVTHDDVQLTINIEEWGEINSDVEF